jgi:hypothetical protein
MQPDRAKNEAFSGELGTVQELPSRMIESQRMSLHGIENKYAHRLWTASQLLAVYRFVFFRFQSINLPLPGSMVHSSHVVPYPTRTANGL